MTIILYGNYLRKPVQYLGPTTEFSDPRGIAVYTSYYEFPIHTYKQYRWARNTRKKWLKHTGRWERYHNI